ncbi:hypothetical protein LCGC14_2871300 [marine sediment metagenome]|uniref:Uncharacterized protein n=1 Tax=marine sediment metagenome TaxID=412755 RepID=A0A0F9AAY8_9ZZZZ
MRDIGSNRITGPEAIMVAAVVWWFDQSTNLGKYVLRAAENVGPAEFTSRIEYDLGLALETELPVGKIIQNFWDLASKNHVVKHMVDQSVRARKGNGSPEKVRNTREFVRRIIISELGLMIKQSGFLEKHEKAIKVAKRRKARNRKYDADD